MSQTMNILQDIDPSGRKEEAALSGTLYWVVSYLDFILGLFFTNMAYV